jgi:hypothetical protein
MAPYVPNCHRARGRARGKSDVIILRAVPGLRVHVLRLAALAGMAGSLASCVTMPSQSAIRPTGADGAVFFKITSNYALDFWQRPTGYAVVRRVPDANSPDHSCYFLRSNSRALSGGTFVAGALADPLGLAVGDKYPTPNQAAMNAIDDYLGQSITEDREYAGVVYKNWDGTYSYTEGHPGSDRDSRPGSAPWLHDEIGIYHTHGAPTPGKDGENFSRPGPDGPGDIGLADQLMEPNWVGTSNLAIKKYDPCTGKITTLRKALP